ncbi:MAG: FG-GAP repeat protein, partial [Chloroflexi bacterium]|nr:FG-GAP repeat protein [Chloroflexota bacterium]
MTPLVLPALAAVPQSIPSSRTALTADVSRPDRAASRVFLPPTYLKNSSIDYPTASSKPAAIEGDTLVIGSRWDAAAYVYTRTVDGAWTRQARLQPLNSGGINGDFGVSVAIDGDTIVVGADMEAGSITSTMDSPNTLTDYAGAAYVFTRSVDGVWTQAAYLKASNAEYDDEFGYGVAIDGDTIVVEATYEDGSYTSTMDSPNNFAADTGAAYVFTRSVTGGWRQAAYLKTPVGLGGSNNTLALEDNTIVFGASWESGSHTSTMDSPNNAATNAGAAYVYTRDVAGTWTQAAYLKASNAEANDSFGTSVALSGDTIVVGAWGEDGSITSTMGSENNAASHAGAAYVYTRSVAGTWTQAAYLKAS